MEPSMTEKLEKETEVPQKKMKVENLKKKTEVCHKEVTAEMSSNPVILETVFSHLSPSDIKRAALVSRTWRMVVEKPRFWTKLRLTVTNNNISEVMQSRSIRLVSGIEFNDLRQNKKTFEMIEELFRAIAICENFKLTELNVSYNDLSSVPADVLGKAIPRLQSVNLLKTDLTDDQVQSIFHMIANCENLKLRVLDIGGNNLSSVPADVLVKAISTLERVNLRLTYLTPDQVQSIFHKIANCENQKLTELCIGGNNLSSIPADELARAISRLETVKMVSTKLTPDQVQSIFHMIADCMNLKLTKLDISPNILSSVPADVLVKAISRLKKVNLKDSDLTPAQIIAIYTLVAERRSSTLREVGIEEESVSAQGISSVPDELRERAKSNSFTSIVLN